MNIQVINIQNDFQQNLNGNVGFLLYCFMNLCVKAEGAAFCRLNLFWVVRLCLSKT